MRYMQPRHPGVDDLFDILKVFEKKAKVRVCRAVEKALGRPGIPWKAISDGGINTELK